MSLSVEQRKFLSDNFSLSDNSIRTMTKEAWHKIKMECMVIEGTEYEKAESNNTDVSIKGKIAEQLVDLAFADLK